MDNDGGTTQRSRSPAIAAPWRDRTVATSLPRFRERSWRWCRARSIGSGSAISDAMSSAVQAFVARRRRSDSSPGPSRSSPQGRLRGRSGRSSAVSCQVT